MHLSWFKRRLFSKSLGELRGIAGRLNRFTRVFWLAGREFRRDFCPERAATLSFATIISLIPLAVLVVSFAVLFGAGEEVIAYTQEKLFPHLAPDFQVELSRWLENNISRDAFRKALDGVVAFSALVTLVLTALGFVVAAERTFNHVWKVVSSRSYFQKLTAFWVVLTTSPFILAASGWVTTKGGMFPSLAERYLVLQLVYSFLVPAMIGFFGFTVLYFFLPSARVRVLSAVTGGAVAAVLWQIALGGFRFYVVRTSSVYGSLAIVPLFLIWIYVNWLIILWGCEIAYAQQNLVHLCELLEKNTKGRRLPPAFLGVYILERIGRSFLTGSTLPLAETLSDELGVAVEEVEVVARTLVKGGILLEDSGQAGRYALGKAPELVPLGAVVELLPGEEVPADLLFHSRRGMKNGGCQVTGTLPCGPATGDIFQRARSGYSQAFEGKSLADLLDSHQ